MDNTSIADELTKLLGPEYLAFKSGHAYLPGYQVIALANEILGYNGWSSEVKLLKTELSSEKNKRHNVLVRCVMRVTLKDGCYREDIGFGSSLNMPSKFQALEKAKKQAVTDATKRTLRLFGESLGNCLYNKEYMDWVKRIKPEKFTFRSEHMRRPEKKAKIDSNAALAGS